jgi:CHASE1-domain containing sensor protein
MMALTGFIPAIAIAAGLLSLEPESALRQQYWPWLPLVLLLLGVLGSVLFWLVFVPWRDRDGSNKRG